MAEQTEATFKVKELERLLGERKISLEQYLEMRTKIEKIKSLEMKENSDELCKPLEDATSPITIKHKNLNKAKRHDFLKTDALVVFSPILLITGVVLMGSTYMSTVETHGLYIYPHFTYGLLFTAVGMFFLVGGVARHASMRKTKSSREFILLEGVGITLSIIGMGCLGWLISFVAEINSLTVTSYYTPIPVWAQGLFSLGMLTCGIFMTLVGLIRAEIIDLSIQGDK